MLPGSGGFLGGFNADVLNAQPTTEESKAKLIEEIKNRAKTCIGARNYPEAVALYTKAIELSMSDVPAQAILHANRSMCYLNMSKGAEALVDADEAVKLDGAYIKGYYRLAMAHSLLHQYAQAKDALQRGLARKPDDKELAAQLIKVEEKIKLEAANQKPVADKPAAVPRAATTVSTKSGASSSSVPSSSTSSASSSLKTKADTVRVDEDDEDVRNLNLRGYKKTADGKTTTFFNNELDEQTKALIGSIAPKKLDAQGEVITTNVAPNSGSAWNSAGTYEEKILTSWATEYLTAQFANLSSTVTTAAEVHPQVSAALPNVAQIVVEVKMSEDISGHAQVTMLRGKKKHVCDYTFSLKWSLLVTFSDDKAPVSVQGTLSVLDVTADKEFEIDQIAVTNLNEASATFYSLPKEIALLVSKYVKDSERGVQKLIVDALNGFWNELKTK